MSPRIVGIGHALYAAAAVGLAILILGYRDFAPMWQAVPAGIPERQIWVDAAGLLVLAAGAGLCFPRTAPAGLLVIGAYAAAWVSIEAARVVARPLSFGVWYGVFEALTPLLGAWILFALLRAPPPPASARPSIASERGVRAAQALFGLNCVVYGLAHFAYADLTVSMVPAWLPYRLDLAYLTGLGHLAAGLGLVAGILPRLAAILESIMMSLFGILVWLPTLASQQLPIWAPTRRYQWSECVVTWLLAGSAWVVASSVRSRSHGERLRRKSES